MVEGKISVIVPSFNYGHLLGETLDNLLLQTYDYWECIIVDDGSKDNTGDVAKHYCNMDSRFRYVFRPNGGIGAARNTGLDIMTGEFVNFLDADDFLSPRKFEIHAKKLNENPTIDVAYSGVRYFLSGNLDQCYPDIFMSGQKWMPEISGNGHNIVDTIVDRNIMVVNSAVFRRKVIDQVGRINEEYRALEDWEFWFRCAMRDIIFDYDPNPEAEAYVRIHPNSTTANVLKMKLAELAFRKQIDRTLGNQTNILPNDIRQRALRINRFRVAQMNVRYFRFIEGWRQGIWLYLSHANGHGSIYDLFKSSIKRILRQA